MVAQQLLSEVTMTRFIAVMAFCAMCSLPAAAEPLKLILATSGDYPPLTDESLEQGGLATALVLGAFEASGHKVDDIQWVPWSRAHLSVVEKEWTKAWTAFEEAVEVVTSYKANWYRAKWQLEWAEAHLQRGEMKDRDRARELLQDARAEFEAMGVSVHVEQATKLLENLA